MYKVYDCKSKQWINNTMLSGNDDLYEIRKSIFGLYKYKLLPNSKYKLFRCTEIFDKKGKAIYEGDILKLHADKGEVICVVSYSPETAAYVALDMSNKRYHYLSEERCRSAEILGNMLENKNLILNTKKENENE